MNTHCLYELRARPRADEPPVSIYMLAPQDMAPTYDQWLGVLLAEQKRLQKSRDERLLDYLGNFLYSCRRAHDEQRRNTTFLQPVAGFGATAWNYSHNSAGATQRAAAIVEVHCHPCYGVAPLPVGLICAGLQGLDDKDRLQVFSCFCARCGRPIEDSDSQGRNYCKEHSSDSQLLEELAIIRAHLFMTDAPKAPCRPFPGGLTCCEKVAPRLCTCVCHTRRIEYFEQLLLKAQASFAKLFGGQSV